MTLTRTYTGLAAIAALGLLAGCGQTEAQKEIKEQGEAVEKTYDAQADLKESLAKGGPNENAADAQADAMREQGDAAKDHFDNLADQAGRQMDEVKGK